MVSGRRYIYGLVSAAVVLGGVLVGCGGSGTVKGISPRVKTAGGLGTDTGAGTAGTSAGATPQQVQVTTSGGTVVTGTLPADTTIPSTGVVAIITPSTILQGLTHPSFHGKVKTPGTNVALARIPYHVYVNAKDTKLTIDTSGALNDYLFLPPKATTPAIYTIEVEGPFDLTDGGNGNLTIGAFRFVVVVFTAGSASVPEKITGNLPGNGGTFDGGNSVTVTYPARARANMVGGSAALNIVYDSKSMYDRDLVGSTGIVTFKNNQAINHGNITSAGVDLVDFTFEKK